MIDEEIEDLVGEKFGSLTVLYYLYHGNKNSVWYQCECVCGNTVKATHSKLINGLIRTCGCRRRGTRDPNDYIGETYGQWTVIEFVRTEAQTYIRYNPDPFETEVKNHYFVARCTCGKEKTATISAIKQGGRYKKCVHDNPKSR